MCLKLVFGIEPKMGTFVFEGVHMEGYELNHVNQEKPGKQRCLKEF